MFNLVSRKDSSAATNFPILHVKNSMSGVAATLIKGEPVHRVLLI
jgi:hypothetical protein